jgi:hypothetical protein
MAEFQVLADPGNLEALVGDGLNKASGVLPWTQRTRWFSPGCRQNLGVGSRTIDESVDWLEDENLQP